MFYADLLFLTFTIVFSVSSSVTPFCYGSSYSSVSYDLCLCHIVRFVDQRQCMACLERTLQQDLHFRWWGEFTLLYLDKQPKNSQSAQQWQEQVLYNGNESLRGHGIHSFYQLISLLNELQCIMLNFRILIFNGSFCP